ncbi:Gfo/Idh/MocA family protein [Saliphagus sp. LR7]|uniref:Gfo/Idh/MocA family protein n=1 Tax=Saliphagus sp. LR7 TaxID=2282654 RepID=UPI000DF7AAE5|nr:Gfo/Idh/MocA family oxidoreductase [Saliphagus sp. LR7]
MDETIRTAVVGTGGWGTHVATQFHENPGAEVVALADVAEASRERAGEQLAVAPDHRYESHEEMFESEDLDAVQISSPHTLHYDHIMDALDAGLHVFCEKPFTPGVDRAREITERVEGSEEVFMVGYQRHLCTAYVELREAIAAGEIEPKFVTAEIAQDWIQNVAGTWRVNPDLSGGGQLYDSGSHVLDAIVWMLDARPTSVSAEMSYYHEAERIDLQAALSAEFEDGTVASIGVSGDSPDVLERIAIRGDGGRGIIEGEGWDDRHLIRTGAEGESETIEGVLSTAEKVGAFLKSVREGTEPPATARTALYATMLTEAAYESARTGERVEIKY